MIKKPKQLRDLVIAVGLVGGITAAHASVVGDTPEIAKLRAEYIEAVTSNSPEAVAKLVSDDYVMLQPDPKGPDTYGKTAYINYRKSLNPVASMTVEPDRVIRCGGDWAFEASIEKLEWNLSGIKNYPTTARVVKVLNRQEDGEWIYARTIRAWDHWSHVSPPAPEFIANTGFGTWEPRKQSRAKAKLAQEMMDFQNNGTKNLVSTDDSIDFMKQVVIKADESTGEMIAYGTEGAIYGFDQYIQMRYGLATTPSDEVRKYFKEALMCDNEMGFLWGQDIASGTNILDGKRWIGSGDFFYLMKKQGGEWKLGPVGVVYGETEGE